MKSVKDLKQQKLDLELAKYYRGNWNSYAKDPQVWLGYAENLKTAADTLGRSLWPKDRKRFNTKAAVADFIYGPVYMLLAGLAVETLIKGVIVGQKPELIKRQKLSSELTNHNLIKLYQTAGLRESKCRNDLLLRLQNYVEIFGRYPVTKTKHDMQKLTKTRFAGQTDPARIDRLWNFLVLKIRFYIKVRGITKAR